MSFTGLSPSLMIYHHGVLRKIKIKNGAKMGWSNSVRLLCQGQCPGAEGQAAKDALGLVA